MQKANKCIYPSFCSEILVGICFYAILTLLIAGLKQLTKNTSHDQASKIEITA